VLEVHSDAMKVGSAFEVPKVLPTLKSIVEFSKIRDIFKLKHRKKFR